MNCTARTLRAILSSRSFNTTTSGGGAATNLRASRSVFSLLTYFKLPEQGQSILTTQRNQSIKQPLVVIIGFDYI